MSQEGPDVLGAVHGLIQAGRGRQGEEAGTEPAWEVSQLRELSTETQVPPCSGGTAGEGTVGGENPPLCRQLHVSNSAGPTPSRPTSS